MSGEKDDLETVHVRHEDAVDMQDQCHLFFFDDVVCNTCIVGVNYETIFFKELAKLLIPLQRNL